MRSCHVRDIYEDLISICETVDNDTLNREHDTYDQQMLAIINVETHPTPDTMHACTGRPGSVASSMLYNLLDWIVWHSTGPTIYRSTTCPIPIYTMSQC